MRLVLLSDTHSMHDRVSVPDGDVVVHAGDWSGRGNALCLKRFCEWFAMLPHKYRVFIAGNHDWSAAIPENRERLQDPSWWGPKANAHFLHDSGCEIDGVTFYGSPWQPEFCDWAFNLPRGAALAEVWAKIPGGVDVLVTHGPALGVLDLCPDGRRVGCADLAVAIEERVRPKLHVCGHIHHSHGASRSATSGTLHVNASICTEAYQPINEPIVVDLVGGVASVVTTERSQA